MTTWKRLAEAIKTISEALQYRGASALTLADLTKLGEKAGFHPDPNGGMARTDYPFDPSIWSGWTGNQSQAIIMASTDTKRDVQHVGAPQGGTVMKRNYGGRVVYQPGPQRPHANDRLGSTMDRYDVLMVAELGSKTNRKGESVPTGRLVRIAYAPSIGAHEERAARLQALLQGHGAPPLSRRPQPDRPEPPKDAPSSPEPDPEDVRRQSPWRRDPRG